MSKSDMLREHIDKIIAEKRFDVFSIASKKRNDMDEIIKKYPKIFEKKSLPQLYNKIMDERLIKNNIPPETLKIKSPKKLLKFNTGSDMNDLSQPEPQPNITHHNAHVHKIDGSGSAESAAPATPAPPAQPSGVTEEKPWAEHIDEEMIGAFFQGLLAPPKIWYPNLKGWTEEEERRLGKMWTPAAKRYLTEAQAILLLPALATLSMMMEKVKQAKDERDAEKKKSEKDLQEPKNE